MLANLFVGLIGIFDFKPVPPRRALLALMAFKVAENFCWVLDVAERTGINASGGFGNEIISLLAG